MCGIDAVRDTERNKIKEKTQKETHPSIDSWIKTVATLDQEKKWIFKMMLDQLGNQLIF